MKSPRRSRWPGDESSSLPSRGKQEEQPTALGAQRLSRLQRRADAKKLLIFILVGVVGTPFLEVFEAGSASQLRVSRWLYSLCAEIPCHRNLRRKT